MIMEVDKVDLSVKIEVKEESLIEGLYEIKEENVSIEDTPCEQFNLSSSIKNEDESTKKYFKPIKLETIVDKSILALSRNEESENGNEELVNLINDSITTDYTKGENCGRNIDKWTLLKNKLSCAKPPKSAHKGFASFQCDECNAGFAWKYQLKSHIRTHSVVKYSKCINGASCTQKMTLKHTRIHAVNKPFKCDICNKRFSRSDSLKRHTRIHSGSKPYKCDTCDKRFSDIRNLKTHISIHTGSKPYKCDTCDKRFSDIRNLKAHIRIHIGSKPYKCDTCDKRFLVIRNLKTHIRIHTGSKPYKCDTCDKRFSDSSNLKKHIRIHTESKPFICDTCDKRFTESGSLKKHIRIHTGIKPFKCDTCNKRFTQSSVLKAHVMTHIGSKPYKCDTCDKRFTRNDNLKKHIRSHIAIHTT